MAIDYTGLGIPKTGKTPKQRRASRRRKALKAAADDRDTKVMNRYGGRCIAQGISPKCTYWADDPHELIPVGRGGPRESWNRVPTCRADHREAQGRVGGNRLHYDWDGRTDGKRPNADKLGSIKVSWQPKQNDPKTFITTWR